MNNYGSKNAHFKKEPDSKMSKSYFHLCNTSSSCYVSSRISQVTFEYILFNFNEKYNDMKKTPNIYTLYHHDGIYFKIFKDGSCFCFKKNNNKLIKHESYLEETYNQINVKNDEFKNEFNYQDIFETQDIQFRDDDKLINIFFKKVVYNGTNVFYQINIEGCKNMESEYFNDLRNFLINSEKSYL